MECNIYGSIEQMTKDFTGWTSKVRLVASGHCHCDRLDAKTNGENLSFAIAYTGSANPDGFKSELDYYIPVFGTDGKTATWGDLKDRTVGTISEALIDIYIVNSNNIHKIRFGVGNDASLNI
jgi:hypothetical protein